VADHLRLTGKAILDNRVRHELLSNGNCDEASGGCESAYQGRYVVKGYEISFGDD
jgi:uncharacterized protein